MYFETVYRNLAERLERGSLIAEVQTIFGETIEAIHAPSDYDTVVVGLENNPVAKRGNRVVSTMNRCDAVCIPKVPWASNNFF